MSVEYADELDEGVWERVIAPKYDVFPGFGAMLEAIVAAGEAQGLTRGSVLDAFDEYAQAWYRQRDLNTYECDLRIINGDPRRWEQRRASEIDMTDGG